MNINSQYASIKIKSKTLIGVGINEYIGLWRMIEPTPLYRALHFFHVLQPLNICYAYNLYIQYIDYQQTQPKHFEVQVLSPSFICLV